MLLTLPPNRRWRILKQQQGKYISNQEMKELKTVKADWDLFRRPLMVANARYTSSLREILSYELSPVTVPSSLVHNDGITRKLSPESSQPFCLEAILRRDNFKKDFHSWFAFQNKKEYKNRELQYLTVKMQERGASTNSGQFEATPESRKHQTFIWRSWLAAMQDLHSPHTKDSYLRLRSCST